MPPPTILFCRTNLRPQMSLWCALGLSVSKFLWRSVRELNPSRRLPSTGVMMLSWYWHTNRWLLSQLCGRQLPLVDNCWVK